MTDRSDSILSVNGLEIVLGSPSDRRTVVSNVDFDLGRGKTAALVGESGSGKTTIARAVMGLTPFSRGRITVFPDRAAEIPIPARGRHEHERLCKAVQMVFQDPMAALDPRVRAGKSILEPKSALRILGRDDEILEQVLRDVGLSPDLQDRYPHELSGGQRQRVLLARALVSKPELLILDEPVSALDISIRAQILNVLMELQRSQRMAMLFITHDLGTVRALADEILVLFAGRIVEAGPTESVLDSPQHPYTQALMGAVPSSDPEVARKTWRSLKSDASTLAHSPLGCPYAIRCPMVETACRTEIPNLVSVGPRRIACHPVSRQGDQGP